MWRRLRSRVYISSERPHHRDRARLSRENATRPGGDDVLERAHAIDTVIPVRARATTTDAIERARESGVLTRGVVALEARVTDDVRARDARVR